MKLPQRPIGLLFGETDQVVVALADGAIEVRVIATGATLRRMDAGARQDVLALSADGRVLATAGTEQIRLWDASGKLLHTLGRLLYTTLKGQELNVWAIPGSSSSASEPAALK